jgi:hypothetical protein
MRVALVQTQAELASAQRVAVCLADGLRLNGHDVKNIFFYRKSSTSEVDDDTGVLYDT